METSIDRKDKTKNHSKAFEDWDLKPLTMQVKGKQAIFQLIDQTNQVIKSDNGWYGCLPPQR